MKTTDLALCLALGLAAGAAASIEEKPHFAAREFVAEYLAARPREAVELLERELPQAELDVLEKAMTEAIASRTPRCKGARNLGEGLRLPDWESFFVENSVVPETDARNTDPLLRRGAADDKPRKGESR